MLRKKLINTTSYKEISWSCVYFFSPDLTNIHPITSKKLKLFLHNRYITTTMTTFRSINITSIKLMYFNKFCNISFTRYPYPTVRIKMIWLYTIISNKPTVLWNRIEIFHIPSHQIIFIPKRIPIEIKQVHISILLYHHRPTRVYASIHYIILKQSICNNQRTLYPTQHDTTLDKTSSLFPFIRCTHTLSLSLFEHISQLLYVTHLHTITTSWSYTRKMFINVT